MGKHSETAVNPVEKITDNDFVNKLEGIAAGVLRDQPWWNRRKNTLVAIATIILQVANVAVFALVGAPLWVTIAVAAVICLAEVVVHAATKSPVTPGSTEKIRRTAERSTESGSAMADHYQCE